VRGGHQGGLATRVRGALPAVSAAVALTVGLVDLVSALTPNAAWRGRLLAQAEPIEAMRIFHALAVPLSAALLLTSVYLLRRRRRALYLALGLLLTLAALNVAKGLDVEEAIVTLGGAGLLSWGRDAFNVRHGPASLRSALWRLPALWAGVVALASLGVWVGSHHSGVATIAREVGDLLLWQRGPLAFHDEVGHVPLGVHLLAVLGLAATAYVVFRPLGAPRGLPDAGARRLATALVRQHGSDTLAFFKLRADSHYLFSPDRRAFVGYRVESGVLLCSGDPVGHPSAVPAAIAEAGAFAERYGLKLAVVGASDETATHFERAGLRRLYIGDEAIVETARFTLEGRAVRKVRQSVARLERAGYSFDVARLGDLSETCVAELESVSQAWLGGCRERGFSMAMDGLRGEHVCESLVVCGRDADGRVRAFLHFVPSYGRDAVSLSFMRRDRDTPNGLTEFLVARGIELLRERGVGEVSLNFAAFARLLHSPRGPLDRVLARCVTAGDAFFQIERLYRFNAKFHPRWEPRYLLYEGALGLPRAGLAVLWVEGQVPRPFRRRAAV
jgi:lysyl-tRNA synthetase, class II